jgi:phosphoribosylamine-glycine ligase
MTKYIIADGRRPMTFHVIMEKAKIARSDPKKVLVWDFDWGAELAARFAKDGHDVLYYTDWPESHPQFAKFAVGMGLDGVEKSKYFFEDYKNVDYIVFLETECGTLCADLRDQGYNVFGPGRGAKLETQRAWAKEEMKKIGLSVAPYEVIKGVDPVIAYVEKNGGRWIKQDIFRGDKETFFAKDAAGARTELNYLRPKVGPFEQSREFIVEEPLKDPVEAGWDLFFNGHAYLKPYLWGYCQNRFYVGKYVDVMPPALEEVAEKMIPVLQEMDYRGIISMEAQVVKDGTAYVTDWTTRFPFPLSWAYEHSLNNFSDVIFAVADGKDIELDIKNKYVGYMEAHAIDLQDGWLEVSFPDKYRDNIKLRKPAKYKGKYYAMATIDQILGAVVDTGSNINQMFDRIVDIGEEIEANTCDAGEAGDSVYRIHEAIKLGKKRGLKF